MSELVPEGRISMFEIPAGNDAPPLTNYQQPLAMDKKKHNMHKSKTAIQKEKLITKQQASRQQKQQQQGQSVNSCLPPTCLDLAVSYMGLVRSRVANFQKQLARLLKQDLAIQTKAAKGANAFQNTLNQLILSGGGNISSLACGNSPNNTGYRREHNNKFQQDFQTPVFHHFNLL